ncbi:MAG: alpha/beta hydrolase [Candidatus Thermoplasmatota archaeon]|nr:alpha/beta hydrolase [Candidatus Thermoplasmatota archaeon]
MSGVKYILTEEGKISFEDTGGNGVPVICVPGMGDLRSVYRFVTGDLKRRGYRIITMDLRGMGDSTVRWRDYSESSIALDIVLLINQLGLKSVILMGNSISAGAAVIVSAQHPGLISKVVLVSPFVRNVPISRLKLLLFRLVLARPWGASVWTSYQSSRLYPSMKPPDMEAYSLSLRTMLKQRGRMKAFQKMASTKHDKAEESLEHMNVPAMMVMGSKDPDFPDPKKELDWLAARTGAKSIMIEGAGHYPQAEYPEKFIAYLTDFIGEESVS